MFELNQDPFLWQCASGALVVGLVVMAGLFWAYVRETDGELDAKDEKIASYVSAAAVVAHTWRNARAAEAASARFPGDRGMQRANDARAALNRAVLYMEQLQPPTATETPIPESGVRVVRGVVVVKEAANG